MQLLRLTAMRRRHPTSSFLAACVLVVFGLSCTGFLAPGPHVRSPKALEPAVSGQGPPSLADSRGIFAICGSGLGLVVLARSATGVLRTARTPCLAKKKKGGGGAAPARADEGDADIDTEAVVAEFEDKMKKSVGLLEDNLRTIRAGKATPSLLDSVKVNAYETVMKLEEVATVTAADSTTLMVNVFDETVVSAVLKAIQIADLGFGASEMGQSVKVSIPPLTKEKRAQYVKLAKDYAEKSKVAVRNVRQQGMKKIKSFNKKLPEDTVRAMEQDVEAAVKKSVADIDSMFKSKETELNTL